MKRQAGQNDRAIERRCIILRLHNSDQSDKTRTRECCRKPALKLDADNDEALKLCWTKFQ